MHSFRPKRVTSSSSRVQYSTWITPLGCIEGMRCRLMSPVCAVSVRQSVCLSVTRLNSALLCGGHSVQPLPNHFGRRPRRFVSFWHAMIANFAVGESQCRYWMLRNPDSCSEFRWHESRSRNIIVSRDQRWWSTTRPVIALPSLRLLSLALMPPEQLPSKQLFSYFCSCAVSTALHTTATGDWKKPRTTCGALKMRDWKMRDWNYREQETYGTPRVA